jgi:hypothetical protein
MDGKEDTEITNNKNNECGYKVSMITTMHYE